MLGNEVLEYFLVVKGLWLDNRERCCSLDSSSIPDGPGCLLNKEFVGRHTCFMLVGVLVFRIGRSLGRRIRMSV